MNTEQNTPSSYDEVLYESVPFPQTHPDRLATLARLFGMAPQPVERCRVLELGCATGGNLIPMAFDLAGSQFVGVDLSARQIARGRAQVEALGLSNVDLRHLSILDIDESFGKFDYIIAHGVYSWVPGPVRDKILEVCGQNLEPNGVAYVSYNTYPGWRMRGMIRDMMQYHVQQFQDPKMRVAQARALLDFTSKAVPSQNNPYGMLLQQEVAFLSKLPDFYLLHEYMEDVNEPVYFYEFAKQAEEKGLQYLAETDFHTMLAESFPKEVAETLRRVGQDTVRLEQYMDFVRNRIFRQTLLVHADVSLNRNIGWAQVEPLLVASPAKPVSKHPNISSAAPEEFRASGGATLVTRDPITKSAMTVLAETWPQALPFGELCGNARARLSPSPSQLMTPDAETRSRDRQLLGGDVLRGYGAGIFELHTRQGQFVQKVSDRPVASPLARMQAKNGLQVAGLRHQLVKLDELHRQLLLLLDGSRNREALVAELAAKMGDGTLKAHMDGRPLAPERARRELEQVVGQLLDNLAANALLVA